MKSALKTIQNDTEIAYELYNFPIENRLFNFCVGKTLNGKSPEVSGIFSKDPLVNLEHFDTNLMGAVDCGYMVSAEKPDFTGVKIAWVDMKSIKFHQNDDF